MNGWWKRIRDDVKDLDMHLSEYKEGGEIRVTRHAVQVAIAKTEKILKQLQKALEGAPR